MELGYKLSAVLEDRQQWLTSQDVLENVIKTLQTASYRNCMDDSMIIAINDLRSICATRLRQIGLLDDAEEILLDIQAKYTSSSQRRNAISMAGTLKELAMIALEREDGKKAEDLCISALSIVDKLGHDHPEKTQYHMQLLVLRATIAESLEDMEKAKELDMEVLACDFQLRHQVDISQRNAWIMPTLCRRVCGAYYHQVKMSTKDIIESDWFKSIVVTAEALEQVFLMRDWMTQQERHGKVGHYIVSQFQENMSRAYTAAQGDEWDILTLRVSCIYKEIDQYGYSSIPSDVHFMRSLMIAMRPVGAFVCVTQKDCWEEMKTNIYKWEDHMQTIISDYRESFIYKST